MVGAGIEALFLQEGGHLFGAVAGGAVDDARFALVTAVADETQQLGVGVLLLDDVVADVGPVEAGDEGPGVFQHQPGDDFLPGEIVGGGGERNAWHLRKLVGQTAETDVFGPEVVPPLRNAVGLVDGDQPQPCLMQQGQTAFGKQPLGGHVEQLQLATAHLALHRSGFLRRQGGVEIGGRHAQFAQRGHLVLHQGDERRDHHGHAIAHQGGNLVAERLAPPGGHQDQRIATAGHVLDDVVLHAPEGGVAEHAVQDFFRAHGGMQAREGQDRTGQAAFYLGASRDFRGPVHMAQVMWIVRLSGAPGRRTRCRSCVSPCLHTTGPARRGPPAATGHLQRRAVVCRPFICPTAPPGAAVLLAITMLGIRYWQMA